MDLSKDQTRSLLSVLNRLSDGIVIFDHSQCIRLANERAAQYLGGKENARTGTRFSYSYEVGKARILTNVENATQFTTLELRVDQIRWFDTSMFMARFYDAYDRVQTEEIQKKLNYTDHLVAMGQLAAGVGHEINNPAAFVLANLDTMGSHVGKIGQFMSALRDYISKEEDGERQVELDSIVTRFQFELLSIDMREMLTESIFGMERIASIVRDLKTFFRIEASNVELVDLNEIVKVASNMVNNEIRHRARLVQDFHQLPKIPAEQGKLTQVVMNLLVNAAQSIREGEAEHNQILVATRVVEKELHLTVKDTGSGIPQNLVGRIFEPFFTTKPREQGVGLGLSICAEIIRKHRGRIEVSSSWGAGSEFHLILPLDTGLSVTPALKEKKIRAPRSYSQGALKDPARVLVIEDEPALLRALRRTLSPPHEVVTAEGGTEGLNILERDPRFHVILCDLMMPEVDGPRIYQVVREKYPELLNRIVFCTGGAFTPRTKDFIASVENVILEKPINTELLKETVFRIKALCGKKGKQI